MNRKQLINLALSTIAGVCAAGVVYYLPAGKWQVVAISLLSALFFVVGRLDGANNEAKLVKAWHERRGKTLEAIAKAAEFTGAEEHLPEHVAQMLRNARANQGLVENLTKWRKVTSALDALTAAARSHVSRVAKEAAHVNPDREETMSACTQFADVVTACDHVLNGNGAPR